MIDGIAVPKGTIFRDEAEKKSLETRNGVNQARFVFYTVTHWTYGAAVSPKLVLVLRSGA